MEAIVVVGGSGTFGSVIRKELAKTHRVYSMQRKCHHPGDVPRWIASDLSDPSQTLLAVHKLFDDQIEHQEPLVRAVIFAQKCTSSISSGLLTSYDMTEAVNVTTLEPLMFIKYLLEFGVMKLEGVVFWLNDSNQLEPKKLPHFVAKAGMASMVREFEKTLVGGPANCILSPEAAWNLGAADKLAKAIAGLIEDSKDGKEIPKEKIL